jgi:hypothetical protein
MLVMTKNLDDAIAEKQRLIERLRAELTVLMQAKALLTRGGKRPAKVARVLLVETRMNPSSAVGMTLTALQDAGKPMHIDRILDVIEGKTGKRPKKVSLVGSLSQYVRDQRIFTRPAAMTFGLKEWTEVR